MSFGGLLSGLDMPTLFFMRAFTQIVLACVVAAVTLRWGFAAAVLWLAAAVATCCGWLLLPLGLASQSMPPIVASTTLMVLAALLHLKSIAIHVERRFSPFLIILPPFAVGFATLMLGLDAIDAGTLMCLVAATVMLVGAFSLRARLRERARTETFLVLMLATGVNFLAAVSRGVGAIVWPDAFSTATPATPQVLVPYICTFIGMIALNLAFVSLIKDRGEKALERLALQDSLTMLWNRRGLEERAWRVARRVLSANSAVSVVALDIDHFKSTNDRWGHAFGDEALVRFARAVRENCRSGDFAARIGGEEFCLVLPDTDVSGALALVERLRERLAQDLFLPDATSLRFSAGIAALLPDDPDPAFALARADGALYAAKTNGRSRSEVAKPVAA